MVSENQMKYQFAFATKCDMCGDDVRNHKILGQRLNQSQGFKPKNKIGITTTIVKCSNCKLIYSNPQPIPNSIEDHYGVPADSYWKPHYFHIDEETVSKEIKEIKQLMPIQKGMKALDIGAGIGKTMTVLQMEGFDVYGMEPSEHFRNKAIEKMKINPERLKLSMVEDAEYENNFFDYITFGAVLEHLYSPGGVLEKAMKWLKPNGLVHLEVPSSRYLVAKIINFYYKLIGTSFVTNLSPMHNPYHLFEFDLKSFEEHAKKHNYEIAYRKYYVCSIPFFPGFLKPVLNWIMEKTNSGLQITVYLRKKG